MSWRVPGSGGLWFQFISQDHIFILCWLSPHPCLKSKTILIHNSRDGSGEERKDEGEGQGEREGEGKEGLHLSGRQCDTLS